MLAERGRGSTCRWCSSSSSSGMASSSPPLPCVDAAAECAWTCAFDEVDASGAGSGTRWMPSASSSSSIRPRLLVLPFKGASLRLEFARVGDVPPRGVGRAFAENGDAPGCAAPRTAGKVCDVLRALPGDVAAAGAAAMLGGLGVIKLCGTAYGDADVGRLAGRKPAAEVVAGPCMRVPPTTMGAVRGGGGTTDGVSPSPPRRRALLLPGDVYVATAVFGSGGRGRVSLAAANGAGSAIARASAIAAACRCRALVGRPLFDVLRGPADAGRVRCGGGGAGEASAGVGEGTRCESDTSVGSSTLAANGDMALPALALAGRLRTLLADRGRDAVSPSTSVYSFSPRRPDAKDDTMRSSSSCFSASLRSTSVLRIGSTCSSRPRIAWLSVMMRSSSSRRTLMFRLRGPTPLAADCGRPPVLTEGAACRISCILESRIRLSRSISV